MTILPESQLRDRRDSRTIRKSLREVLIHCLPVVVTALLVILSQASPVLAHKVNVFAYVDIDKLVVEGYFGGKAAAVNSPVELFDGEGKKVLEGRTDEKGTWSVKLADLPPIKGDLLVVLAAGSGHRADYTLPAADLASRLKGTGTAAAVEPGGQVQAAGQAVEPGAPTPSASPADIARGPAVSTAMPVEALAARLDRMEAMLSAQQKMLMEQKTKGPSMTEIIGGIGWIFGIVGVAAYFLSRDRSKT